MAKRPGLGWLIWASVTVTCGSYLIYRASTVTPTPFGIEFIDLGNSYVLLGFLPILATCFVACWTTRRRVLWWLLSAALTVMGWAWVHHFMWEVQFVRTPPCWGMHSVDPGSGESCLPGMREDFTVPQLRNYYQNLRDSAKDQ